ncbi:MAG: ComF operon protein 1 [Candidatus Dichloromethanomonas elyunquensis]|nr:MAG: ComF operon protein 1 [Candidatus Dichloromethanomonas elyunquensis]
MLFYTLINKSGQIRFSPIPLVDMLWEDSTIIGGKLPLEVLHRSLNAIRLTKPSNNTTTSMQEFQSDLIRQLKTVLQKNGDVRTENIVLDKPLFNMETREKYKGIFYNDDLYSAFLSGVNGRQLAEGELPYLMKHLQCDEDTIKILMHKAVLIDQYEWLPAIRRSKGNWSCQRCGNMDCQEWISVYGYAATCQECRSIGPLNSLQVIFRSPKSGHRSLFNRVEANIFHKFNFEFSHAQQKAALELLALCEKDEVQRILVWAVCGAGKTEISFPLIYKYLSEGKSVLFAAPRQDVVHDVQPRLQRNFPQIKVRIFSGAVTPEWEDSLLTVATTHQLLRFYKTFSLILFDEMDAYPYPGNKVLEFGLNQALQEGGRLIYLTATPPDSLLREVKRGESEIIRLSLRHHGFPVPIPEWAKANFPDKSASLQEILKKKDSITWRKILEELAEEGPLLVFVPRIGMVPIWTETLRGVFHEKQVEGSWSSDPYRLEKVKSFLNGNCQVFVSTSILERGITVNRVQVAVLFADDEQYDTRALIQMAGRTGRTQAHPWGRTVFLAAKQTKAIKKALAWIQEQNTIGERESFS